MTDEKTITLKELESLSDPIPLKLQRCAGCNEEKKTITINLNVEGVFIWDETKKEYVLSEVHAAESFGLMLGYEPETQCDECGDKLNDA